MSDNYDYSAAYYHLFRSITKSLDRLEELMHLVPPGEFDTIRELADIAQTLKDAQCAAEDMYIEDEV